MLPSDWETVEESTSQSLSSSASSTSHPRGLSSKLLVTSSYLLLVVRPGAPNSVLAPSSDARSPVRSFLLLVVPKISAIPFRKDPYSLHRVTSPWEQAGNKRPDGT